MKRSRYLRILIFFSRTLAGLILWELILPRLGLRGWTLRTRTARLRKVGAGYRRLAIRLGGVLIKVGQFFSARVDVLPEEITSELSGLQDEVPAEDFEAIRRLAEEELGEPLSTRFASFDPVPLAAASLGQVHRARLSAPWEVPGEGSITDVVVKIQRPGIEAVVATDMSALRTVGSWLQRYRPIRRRADVPALMDELGRVLAEEIDYLNEASNAEKFGENFRDRPGVRVPRVIWPHTTLRVLTLEDVYAIKISDYGGITAAGVDRAEVAERLFDTYMQQIFSDGFVHADPHPGNLFIETGPNGGAEPPGWELTFVDFGMTTRVGPDVREGLMEIAIGVGTRDSDRLVGAYQKLGVLLPGADLELIRKAEARAFDRLWGRSMAELREISFDEMREFSREFQDVIYQMPFQVPQDLVLLFRTIAILSGMCTGLNPDFNLWVSMAPYAQQFIAREAGSDAGRWLQEALKILQALIQTPMRLERVLGMMEAGQLEVRAPQVSDQVSRLEFAVRRLVGALIFAAFLISGTQVYLTGQTEMGIVLLSGALAALVWVILARQ